MGTLKRQILAVLVIFTLVFASASLAFAADSPGEGGDQTAKAAKITYINSTMNYANKSLTVTYKGTNCAKYKVAYRVYGGSWSYKTTTKTSFKRTGLKNGKLYETKVAGINKKGKVGKYSKISRRYMAATTFKATAGKGKVTVKINKLSGATGYQIRYSKKSSMANATTVNTTSLSKTLKLKKGTYYIQVRPYKTVGGTKYVGTYTTKLKRKVN